MLFRSKDASQINSLAEEKSHFFIAWKLFTKAEAFLTEELVELRRDTRTTDIMKYLLHATLLTDLLEQQKGKSLLFETKLVNMNAEI